MKKLIFISFFFLLATFMFPKTYISSHFKIKETGTNYGDWEPSRILIDLVEYRDRIIIYSNKTQIYDYAITSTNIYSDRVVIKAIVEDENYKYGDLIYTYYPDKIYLEFIYNDISFIYFIKQ